MRIAVIASLLPADTVGGAERYVAAVARSLAERHEVVILTGSERAASMASTPSGFRTCRI